MDKADPQIGLLFSTMEDGTREWLHYLGEVEDEALAWQPVSGGHSIGGLILHIADAEELWVAERLLGRPRSAPFSSFTAAVRQGTWPVLPSMTFAECLGVLRETRERTRSLIPEIDPDRTILHPRLQVPITARWILAHLVQHDSYHGGQAVLLKTQWDSHKRDR